MCHWSASTESFQFLHCNVAIAPACNGWISLPTQTCNMMLSANMQSDSMCNCTSIVFTEWISKYFPFCLQVTSKWWAAEISNTLLGTSIQSCGYFCPAVLHFSGSHPCNRMEIFLLFSTTEAQLSLNLFYGCSAQLLSPLYIYSMVETFPLCVFILLLCVYSSWEWGWCRQPSQFFVFAAPHIVKCRFCGLLPTAI